MWLPGLVLFFFPILGYGSGKARNFFSLVRSPRDGYRRGSGDHFYSYFFPEMHHQSDEHFIFIAILDLYSLKVVCVGYRFQNSSIFQHYLVLYVCLYSQHFNKQSVDRPGIVANLARSQLNRILFFSCPRSRLRIWSRGTGSTAPCRVSPLILQTQAESGVYARDSSRFPRRRS